MAASPRLFPVDVDIATFVLSREEAGWRLAVRQGVSGGRLLEQEPDVYEACSLAEAADVMAAVVDGIRP